MLLYTKTINFINLYIKGGNHMSINQVQAVVLSTVRGNRNVGKKITIKKKEKERSPADLNCTLQISKCEPCGWLRNAMLRIVDFESIKSQQNVSAHTCHERRLNISKYIAAFIRPTLPLEFVLISDSQSIWPTCRGLNDARNQYVPLELHKD